MGVLNMVQISVMGLKLQQYPVNSVLIKIYNADICPPIHSIVVVTSPNGDHVPPALAAIITSETNHNRSFFSETRALI